MVSRLFGKLEARRHLMVGNSAANAGAATAPAATPALAFFRNERRSTLSPFFMVLLKVIRLLMRPGEPRHYGKPYAALQKNDA